MNCQTSQLCGTFDMQVQWKQQLPARSAKHFVLQVSQNSTQNKHWDVPQQNKFVIIVLLLHVGTTEAEFVSQK